ncbi:hypothetical protein K490DRAFT_31370 [Saccharata proteae CBS 121410]|uniref:Ribosomal RNA-processing protein 8 n=1 Tax=Saccharata proteae CBS 121410 TaxID=1314787 RepID=A0A9P4M1R4_9PEZI|nr:hypothetical protein K490DRAFT_31370 [Saccharata proteae CBS 121410]
MFAVPGWNLSAPLQTQTEVSAAAAAANGAAPSKKRKRSRDKKTNANAAPLVTEDNVADMYARHVEKRPKVEVVQQQPPKEQKEQDKGGEAKAKKNKNKKQKQENGAAGQGAPTPQGKKEKKNKPKKDQSTEKPQSNDSKTTTTTPAPAPAPAPLPPANTKLTPLQASMRAKLASARFRHLNQTLYTTPSQHSLSLIEENPDMFTEYHTGFRQQVAVWPENPVDKFYDLIRARGKAKENWREKRGFGKKGQNGNDVKEKPKPLPRTQGTCTLADLGCGDAALASKLQPQAQKLHLKIHSFDLASVSPLVTKADIANLPLPDNSVDVAIFCLALMGTNWTDFVDEAWRVLRWKGELWVAEIKSRFGRVGGKPAKGAVVEHSVGKRQKKMAAAKGKKGKGGDGAEPEVDAEEELAVEVDGADSKKQETDVTAFVEVLRKRGFVLDAESGKEAQAIDLSNKMFVRMSFVKGAPPIKGKNVKSRDEGQRSGDGAGGTWKPKPKGKFVQVDEKDDGDEATVLKPCVYKLR